MRKTAMVYILMVEDYGILQSVTSYSTEEKAMKELKSRMRDALKSCTMTAAEKKEVRQNVEKLMAYDVDFDEHTQHAYIVTSAVQ